MAIPRITTREQHRQDRPHPFEHCPDDRPLKILVDQRFPAEPVDTFGPYSTATSEPAVPGDLLRGFLEHRALEVIRVSDVLEPGTLTMGKANEPNDTFSFWVQNHEGRKTYSGIWSYRNWVDESQRYGADADDALADFLLARAAVEIDADILITERSRLFNHKSAQIREANAVTPAGALALIGLYLRCRNDFTMIESVWQRDKWRFYWTGARDLLPEGWRWMSACVTHDSGRSDKTATMLAGSLHQRIAHTLAVRDELHRLHFLPHATSTQHDLLAQLDWFLVSLVGAFDVTARVAHLACKFDPGKRRNAAWQRDWRKKIAIVAPELAAELDPGTESRDALDLCTPLRNSVHGEALEGVPHRWEQGEETLVRIPPDDLSELLTIVRRRGGDDHWGIRQTSFDTHLNAGAFVDALLPFACQALNRIMRLTPVEQLTGCAAGIPLSGPPDDAEFGEATRSRIRLLLGA